MNQPRGDYRYNTDSVKLLVHIVIILYAAISPYLVEMF